MNTMDLVLLGVVLLSAVVGILRGLVKEALSLAVWLGSAWAAFHYGGDAADWLSGRIDNPAMRVWAGRLLVFVLLIFVGSIVTWLIGYLVRNSVVTGADRALGLLFGLARGVLVTGLLALALEIGGFGTEPWWRQSKLIPYAAAVGQALRNVAMERSAEGVIVRPG